ncbi:MAG: thioredoxin [Latescibacteria bacterium DG_63]|nr:MAG: thioredoxin [Latescibacteria bacterium DG_63]
MAHNRSPGSAGKKKNRLRFEKSPYLLQHADNPVDWYPWGEEAFEKARNEDKPIFLSIGYSTCHWCHVMARESFEDAVVAQMMNDLFVSIKVDREERPDIDGVYMAVSQRMSGSGGWPLNVLMTPDKKPFFTATYIPKEMRFGRIGMRELISRVGTLWRTRRNEVLRSADQIGSLLEPPSRHSPEQGLDISLLTSVYRELAMKFDEKWGGFGPAPKFPVPHIVFFLLRYWKRTGEETAMKMVEATLDGIMKGGIHDHIGFGFHRYATDVEWRVPHFEKMLYDQAMLTLAYTEAFQATQKGEYAETAKKTFAYVLRDMRSPEGGFFSAEDAESEGVEGKFYVWTEEEIARVLSGEEAALFWKVFDLHAKENSFEENRPEEANTHILHLKQSMEGIASDLGLSAHSLERSLESARQKLFIAREKRVRPQRDEKILADWNGLMIAALAQGARVFENTDYSEAARDAARFVLERMRSRDGRLLHRYCDGDADIGAYLDDFAFFIWGLTELYETTFDVSHLRHSLQLTSDLLAHFWDHDHGGFCFTADDSERLLIREKRVYDGAVPSGNSVAMLNLLRLGRMTGNPDFEAKAVRMGELWSRTLREAPSGHAQLAVALDFALGPSYEIVIAGDSSAHDTEEMMRGLRSRFIPNKVVMLRPIAERVPEIDGVVPFVKNCTSIEGRATAYVCRNQSCTTPTTEVNTMLDLLNCDHG